MVIVRDSRGASGRVRRRGAGGGEDYPAFLAKLTVSDGAMGDAFGCSVAIDGEYVIVGSPRDDSYKGSAYAWRIY